VDFFFSGCLLPLSPVLMLHTVACLEAIVISFSVHLGIVFVFTLAHIVSVRGGLATPLHWHEGFIYVVHTRHINITKTSEPLLAQMQVYYMLIVDNM